MCIPLAWVLPLALLVSSATGQMTVRLTSIEDIFVDGAVDDDWSNMSFGYSHVAVGGEGELCYDLDPYGAVSFARDSDRIWIASGTYLELVVKIEGAQDILLTLEGISDGREHVETRAVSASEILVASQPDDGSALDALMQGDYVDLRVRLKDLLGDVDGEEVPLNQIVLRLASDSQTGEVKEGDTVEGGKKGSVEGGKKDTVEGGKKGTTEGSGEENKQQPQSRLCVAGAVIVDG